MLHLIITFGVLGGIGFGLVISCSMVGINLYFSKRKGQAIGISMTGSTMGFILMPQIVRFFLEEYDFRSAILIIGAISLHAVIGASLFQPVRWHYKVASIEVQEKEAHTLLPSNKIEEKDDSEGS
ncbi:unnamed protein product [Nezara viridula]|uniref:Major facilitator superfamily (MFS) profile domain-containing protein n=1 Tax=Nezara viridula TaxID=85310 RepID=A0A9P0HC50_NEZVI|nr:unnamed protein product [Nezara viridula]